MSPRPLSPTQRTRRPVKTPQGPNESLSGLMPEERVKAMLLEIAFVLHATRVVGRRDEGARINKPR